jgi:hypothetical protein
MILAAVPNTPFQIPRTTGRRTPGKMTPGLPGKSLDGLVNRSTGGGFCPQGRQKEKIKPKPNSS